MHSTALDLFQQLLSLLLVVTLCLLNSRAIHEFIYVLEKLVLSQHHFRLCEFLHEVRMDWLCLLVMVELLLALAQLRLQISYREAQQGYFRLTKLSHLFESVLHPFGYSLQHILLTLVLLRELHNDLLHFRQVQVPVLSAETHLSLIVQRHISFFFESDLFFVQTLFHFVQSLMREYVIKIMLGG